MRTSSAFPVVFILTLLVPIDGASSDQGDPSSAAVALVGGTIHVSPDEDAIADGVVLIRDGRIAAVGARASVRIPGDAETVDCSGLTVVAGLWNSHVHFTERKWADAANAPAGELGQQLQAMLVRYGFTSVFDTGSSWENTRRLRGRIESGEIPGPRIRSTGEILFPPGGAPQPLILDVTGAMRLEMPEVADAAAARAAARTLLDAGADGIKVYAATWARPIVALPEEAIRAAVEEAHRRGKPVFAHPSNRQGLLAAVGGGADVLVHTAPQAGPWDEEILSAMQRANVALIPTLKLWRHELRRDRLSELEHFAGLGVEQLRRWVAAGGEVLFGTDVGYMDDYDPGDEYALMAEAGMTASQILRSLTTAPAARFGDAERAGRIAAGLAADLTVLGEDPFIDVRAFGVVRYTIRDGRVIYRASQ